MMESNYFNLSTAKSILLVCLISGVISQYAETTNYSPILKRSALLDLNELSSATENELVQIYAEIYDDSVLCPIEDFENHYWDDEIQRCVRRRRRNRIGPNKYYRYFTRGSPTTGLNERRYSRSREDKKSFVTFSSHIKDHRKPEPDYSLKAQLARVKRRRYVKIEEFRLANRTTVTCPDINATFSDEYPFDVIGVPQCGDEIEPKSVLFVKGNEGCSMNTSFLPNQNATSCIQTIIENNKNSSRVPVSKVVFVTHGFLGTYDTEWIHWVKDGVLDNDPGAAVIVTGWGHGLNDMNNYTQICGNTRYVGHMFHRVINEINHIVNGNVSDSGNLYFHCIGHSLGAHVCGFAGKAMNSDEQSVRLDRISGLDPAGPLFAKDISWPYNNTYVEEEARLSHNDAIFVDAMHTDGHPRDIGDLLTKGAEPSKAEQTMVLALGDLPQYGTMETRGTVDTYPGGYEGNYGQKQGGCWIIDDLLSCSHSRAWEMYGTSLYNYSCLVSDICQGDPEIIPKFCHSIFGKYKDPVTMGYWWDPTAVFGSNNISQRYGKVVTPLLKYPSMFTVDVDQEGRPPYCNIPFQKSHSNVFDMSSLPQYLFNKFLSFVKMF